MPQVLHYVLRNGQCVLKDQAESPCSCHSSHNRTSTITSEHSQSHLEEISTLRAEYETRIRAYELRILSLEQKLAQKELQVVSSLHRKHKSYQESKSYQETTLTFDAHSICHSFNLPLYQKKENLEGLCENSLFINHVSMNASQKAMNNSSIMEESHYLNTLRTCENENNLVLTEGPKFDSLPLLKRIDRSEQLVKNIRKFLESSIEIEQKNESILSQVSVCPGFADEVLKRHEDIIQLLEKLELEKQKEIEELKEYYQCVIANYLSIDGQGSRTRSQPWFKAGSLAEFKTGSWATFLRDSLERKGEIQHEKSIQMLCFDDQY